MSRVLSSVEKGVAVHELGTPHFSLQQIETGWLLEVISEHGREVYSDDTVREAADRIWRLAERWMRVTAGQHHAALARERMGDAAQAQAMPAAAMGSMQAEASRAFDV